MTEEISDLLLSGMTMESSCETQQSCFETILTAPLPKDIRSTHLQDAVSLFSLYLSELGQLQLKGVKTSETFVCFLSSFCFLRKKQKQKNRRYSFIIMFLEIFDLGLVCKFEIKFQCMRECLYGIGTFMPYESVNQS